MRWANQKHTKVIGWVLLKILISPCCYRSTIAIACMGTYDCFYFLSLYIQFFFCILEKFLHFFLQNCFYFLLKVYFELDTKSLHASLILLLMCAFFVKLKKIVYKKDLLEDITNFSVNFYIKLVLGQFFIKRNQTLFTF